MMKDVGLIINCDSPVKVQYHNIDFDESEQTNYVKKNFSVCTIYL
jgi:hypothetical protein